MKKNRILYLLLLLMSPGVIARAEMPASSEAAAFLRNIKGHPISFSGDELNIRITNENPPGILIPDRAKHFKRFFIIVPENKNATVELKSAGFTLYEDDRKIEEVQKGEESPYKIPDVQELVMYKPSGVFRSWNLASMDILVSKPVQTDKNNRMLCLAQADLRISFSESQAIEVPIMEPDPLGENLLSAITLNPQCMASYRLSAAPKPEEFAPYKSFVSRVNDALTSGPAVKLIVYHSGLYGVSSEDLEQTGVPVNALDPQRMVLYHQNREVPIYMVARDRFTFTPNSKFYFYAPPFPKSTPYDTYWLLYEKFPEINPPRRLTLTSSRVDRDVQVQGNIFKAEKKAQFYKKIYYYHKMPHPVINNNWYWDEVERGSYHYYNVDIACVDTSEKTFDLSVHLTGPVRLMDNYCEVFWNQYSLGSFKWQGLENYTVKKSIPISFLKEGDNELVLYVPPRSEKTQSSSIYFIGFDVDYSMNLTNDYGPLSFTIKKPDAPGIYNLWFAQPQGRSMFLLDVTNPEEPLALPVISSQWVENTITYNYFVKLDLGPQERQFVLGSWEKARTVGRITSASPLSLLFEKGGEGDFIIISPQQFGNHINPYLEFHRQKGNTPLLVNVEDIYDCFNYGIKDFAALKRFFQYRYYYAPGPRLRYALLVGETSDYVGAPNELPPQGQDDLVPTYGVGMNAGEGIHSDIPYTTICGDDDIPDFGLGRFPASTTQDVDTMIRKAMTYDQNLSLGQWRTTHAFVTDDEPEFARIALSIMELFPKYFQVNRIFQQDYPYSDLIMLWQRKTSPKARERLLETINNGALTINYLGHGGPNLWTSERLFHISDISLLVNKEKMFFLTASTCDTSWLDYPVPPVKKSLGELFVLAPNGGAIAVYGPTTGASPSDHQVLMHMFYEGILEKGLLNFSEAMIYSKIGFNCERQNKNVMNQFILLGDPSLSFPRVDVQTKIQTTPQYVFSKKGGKIAIKGTTREQPFWGLVYLVIQPPDPETPPVSLRTHAYDGSFEMEYDISPNAELGTYHISAYMYNQYALLEEQGHTEFNVIKPLVELALDVESPKGGTFFENTNVMVKPMITNPLPVPLEDVLIRLRESALKEPIFERKISLAPLQMTSFNFSWMSEAGIHTLCLEAQLPGDLEEDIIRKQVYIPVYSTTIPHKVAVCPEEIKTKPEFPAEGDKVQLSVPLYNLGTTPFYELQLQLSIAGALIGTPKSIKYLKNLQRIEVPYSSEIALPSGNVPLEIRVDAFNQITKKYDELFKAKRNIEVSKPMDLVIVPDSITFDSEHFLSGETIFINATIKNVGGKVAENFLVQAYKDKPLIPEKLLEPFFSAESTKVKKLNPGEEKKARLRWDNLQSPGKVPIYVVVNSNRAFPEANYDNNVSKAMLEIRAHTNLRIDRNNVRFSQNVLNKGGTIDVSFVVENDSNLPAETFDIAFESWGVNLQLQPCGDMIRVGGIPPKQSLALSTKWRADLPRNHFRIKLNSTYMIQETYRHDNEVEFTFDCHDYLLNLVPLGKEKGYSFKNNLDMGTLYDLELNPLQNLFPTNFNDAHGYRFDVDPQYNVSGRFVDGSAGDEDTDNQWTCKNKWLAASPLENVSPITFSFPLPDDIQTTICDVYIHVQTVQDYKNHPASKLRLKLEKETQFTTYDFSSQKSPYSTARYFLGRYDLVDRFLDVIIDHPEERYWTIANHFEVVPLHSVYQAPIMEIPRRYLNKSFILSADSTVPPETRIEYEYRFGTPDKEGATWGAWKKLETFEAMPPQLIEDRYFQWKADFYSAREDIPVLKDLAFYIKE